MSPNTENSEPPVQFRGQKISSKIYEFDIKKKLKIYTNVSRNMHNIILKVLYLLNFLVCWYRSVHVALVFEPRTDCLQRAIGTAPAAVIHTVLHIVVVTVNTLY